MAENGSSIELENKGDENLVDLSPVIKEVQRFLNSDAAITIKPPDESVDINTPRFQTEKDFTDPEVAALTRFVIIDGINGEKVLLKALTIGGYTSPNGKVYGSGNTLSIIWTNPATDLYNNIRLSSDNANYPPITRSWEDIVGSSGKNKDDAKKEFITHPLTTISVGGWDNNIMQESQIEELKNILHTGKANTKQMEEEIRVLKEERGLGRINDKPSQAQQINNVINELSSHAKVRMVPSN